MSIKILMADGDPRVLELARTTMFSLEWCELVTVKDGREAAKQLASAKFDGVVTSDVLPPVDGFDLIRQLRSSPLNAGIPTVMLTEENDIGIMRRGFKAGVTFFAVKPPNRERCFHLFNAVRGAMETESRRHNRLLYRTRVTCTIENGGRFTAESVEISEGGMSLKPSGGAELDQAVELEFVLPHIAQPSTPAQDPTKPAATPPGEPLKGAQKIRAKVRYVGPEGQFMGVDFLALNPAQREAIQLYVTGGS